VPGAISLAAFGLRLAMSRRDAALATLATAVVYFGVLYLVGHFLAGAF